MLTAEQKAHWETFGFLMLPQLFTSEEVSLMRGEAINLLDEARDSQPFEGAESQTVMPFFERRPSLIGLLEDDRIYETVEDLLGPGFILVLTEAHLSVGDTQWHGGSRTRGVLPNVKMGIYLESVTRDNGCLRVIPGSHRSPLFESLASLKPQFDDPSTTPLGVVGPDVPSVALESEPGDLVVFLEEVCHAAFGGRIGRPRIALNFDAAPSTDARIENIRTEYAKTVYMYRPAKSLLESDRPRLRSMVTPLVDLGFETYDV